MDTHGITVNKVCTGYTYAASLHDLAGNISARTGVKPEEVFANCNRLVPAGRIGTLEEFATVVVFRASKRASYTNGTSVAVDGGEVRSLF